MRDERGVFQPGLGYVSMQRAVFRPPTLSRVLNYGFAFFLGPLAAISPYIAYRIGDPTYAVWALSLGGYLAWHSWRSAHQRIEVDEAAITVAAIHKTRVIPWSDVARIGVGRFGVRELPFVESREGSRADLWLLSKLPWGGKRNPKLEEALRQIQAYRPVQDGTNPGFDR